MSEEYNAKLAIYVDTYTNMSSKVPENGRLFYSSDTGALYIGNGSSAISALNPLGFFDIINGYFGNTDPTVEADFYDATGGCLVRSRSGADQSSGLSFQNSVNNWQLITAATTGLASLVDATNGGITPLRFEPNTMTDLLYGDSDGRIDIGGAFGFGSGGRLTVTTGIYNDLDVTDTGLLFLNGTGGNITLNGMASIGSPLVFYRAIMSGNTLTITHNSGTGNDPFLIKGGSKTSTDYAGGFMIYDGATYWYYGDV